MHMMISEALFATKRFLPEVASFLHKKIELNDVFILQILFHQSLPETEKKQTQQKRSIMLLWAFLRTPKNIDFDRPC